MINILLKYVYTNLLDINKYMYSARNLNPYSTLQKHCFPTMWIINPTETHSYKVTLKSLKRHNRNIYCSLRQKAFA
jgi:hypothetical protein